MFHHDLAADELAVWEATGELPATVETRSIHTAEPSKEVSQEPDWEELLDNLICSAAYGLIWPPNRCPEARVVFFAVQERLSKRYGYLAFIVMVMELSTYNTI